MLLLHMLLFLVFCCHKLLWLKWVSLSLRQRLNTGYAGCLVMRLGKFVVLEVFKTLARSTKNAAT